MSAAYWNQWDYSEIMSMHGVEENQDDMESEQDEYVTTSRQLRCNCSACSYCLDW